MLNFYGIIGHRRELKNLQLLNGDANIPHSILFTGHRGIGKRLIAERLLSSFICKDSTPPCGTCSLCKQIAARVFADLIVLERDDKGKIPVGSRDKPMPGTVRWLIERLSLAPTTDNYSVIIDGVDTISETGQNALLKTIEEPYSKTHIFLISDSRTGILPTIISRCVEIPFQPLKNDELLSILKIKESITDKSEFLVAISGGSAEMAIKLHEDSIFNEIINLCSVISKFVKKEREEMVKFPEIKYISDNEFLLGVLINIYSLMVREDIKKDIRIIPEHIRLNSENAVRVVRILLAIKMGLKNNLNVKNILKGFMYSLKRVDSHGFIEPDFSWLE
jgi:DNA polymerase-3 subunit delta'